MSFHYEISKFSSFYALFCKYSFCPESYRLWIYLPGNGGLLMSVALMCAGYDGCDEEMPGIPKNGKWKVRFESLKKLP